MGDLSFILSTHQWEGLYNYCFLRQRALLRFLGAGHGPAERDWGRYELMFTANMVCDSHSTRSYGLTSWRKEAALTLRGYEMVSSPSPSEPCLLGLMVALVSRGINSPKGLSNAFRCGGLLPDNEAALLFEASISPWWNEGQIPPTPASIFLEFLDVWEALQWKWVARDTPSEQRRLIMGIMKQGLGILDDCASDAEANREVLIGRQQRMLEYEKELGFLHGESATARKTFIDVIQGLPRAGA